MTDLASSHLPADQLSATDTQVDPVENINPWTSPSELRGIHQELDQTVVTVNPDLQLQRKIELAPPDSPTNDSEYGRISSVLSEFDLLASDPVEKSARDAWANAEGHPPPTASKDLSRSSPIPRQSDAVTPQPPLSPVPQSAPPTLTTFPSFASLARSLTLSPRRSLTPPIPPPPPRTSSLRHSQTLSTSPIPPTPPPTGSPLVATSAVSDRLPTHESENSSGATRFEGPTATSSPKPDGQFDFQKFLDQMKTKGADPIAKYLRSFLSNFAKKTFTVNDQVKIIHDFLDFIADKMRTMDGSPWQAVSPQEFDNALEAMEKLVMNRLYEFTFQPLLPPSLRNTDDLERDHVLRQRIMLFGWLQEDHLDVPTGGGPGRGGKEIKGFLDFAQQELLKINHYKAPRDKLICILNCCKVIFGLIRHVHMTEGADSFIPILIFVVLKANPEHLLSNIEYINRFRSPSKLQSEAGYYLSSLMGAVSFIETMDHSSLSNISQDDFERNVEDAIQSLPVTPASSPATPPTLSPTRMLNIPQTSVPSRSPSSPLAGEEAAKPLSLFMPSSGNRSIRAQNPADPNLSQVSLADDTKRFFQRTSDTISKPLAAIGRIFSDMLDGTEPGTAPDSPHKMGWRDLPGPFAPLSVSRPSEGSAVPQGTQPSQPRQTPQTPPRDGTYQPPVQTPYKTRIRPAYPTPPASSFVGSQASDTPVASMTTQSLALGLSHRLSPTPAQRITHADTPHPSRNPTPTLDFAALQDEIDRAHLAARDAARETLMQIFPTVDREVAEMVFEANDGDLGRSIEGLLEISGDDTVVRDESQFI